MNNKDMTNRVPMHQLHAFARMLTVVMLFVIALLAGSSTVDAAVMKLRDVCRVRGQETNTLQGLGLVVGLQGTGDSDAATTSRALARAMQLMGGPISADRMGTLNLDDVSDSKNVALVIVTAEVPAVGAQQGDRVDISVSAISAKSLVGGRLLTTPLLGPRTDDRTAYALAQGQLRVSADGITTVAAVEGGAKMESTVRATFETDGELTLVLDRDFADFDTARTVEEEVNNYMANEVAGDRSFSGGYSKNGSNTAAEIAHAVDQLHVKVRIPEVYRTNPVKFISGILDLTVRLGSKSSRVVIDESEGIVVIGRDVEIAPVLVTHRNIRIQAGGSGLVAIGENADPDSNGKLKDLADALRALSVPNEDLIAIIKTLKAKGDLYGEVIFR